MSMIGHYRIGEKLGEGGMGAVYRATDTKLNREVAVKVLPAGVAEDATRMARFEREAQVLASLNHPNIAAIYGIEAGAIVMELVAGEDLKGPVPVDVAIGYAKQIAAGLEAAHEKGIVHRDLKPANIKVTPDGVVKLLDFGLAKATESSAVAASAASPTMSPTLSLAMTQAGMILGTAAYMSPEQARGKPVDKRADIWAFGVVLYELLTGTMLFAGGETVSDTLAAVLTREPDLERVPVRFRRLLELCLKKDPRQRLRDIGDAQILLDEREPAAAIPVAAAPNRAWLPWAVAAMCALGGGAGWWRATRPGEAPRKIQLSLLAPEKSNFEPSVPAAVSPDGRYLTFVAETDGKRQLWLRDMAVSNARPLPGTETAAFPFWSPDSRYIAFFTEGKLKKIDVAGGPAVTICNATSGRGGSWGPNDVIVFAPNSANALFRVSASGGAAAQLGTLNGAEGENSHRFPWFLPDGRHYLFLARNVNPEKSVIYVGDLQSADRRKVATAPSNAMYASGYLLYVRENALVAQPFDTGALHTTGDTSPLLDGIGYSTINSLGMFSVSGNGLLAYRTGAVTAFVLTWFDRSGNTLGTVGPPGNQTVPAISPDGSQVAVERGDLNSGSDIWLHDLKHGTDSRFTFDPAEDRAPVWSSDGSKILFTSRRKGKWGVYQKPANGSAPEELLYEMDNTIALTTDWSRDGRLAILQYLGATSRYDIGVFSLPDRKFSPFLDTPYTEVQGKLSPDGRWLAYNSGETGEAQVYVQSFPGREGRWQISSAGGGNPVWSRDGRELFFVAGDQVMAVDVKTGTKFEHAVPKLLFKFRRAPNSGFAVSPDGKRFLGVVAPEQVVSTIQVVIHWAAELKR